jgi:hypothetical protein
MTQEKLVQGKMIVQQVGQEKKIIRVYLSDSKRIEKDLVMLNSLKSNDVTLSVEDVEVIIQEVNQFPFSAPF